MDNKTLANYLFHQPTVLDTFLDKLFSWFIFDMNEPGSLEYETRRLKRIGLSNKDIKKIRGILIKSYRLAFKKLKKEFNIKDEFNASFTDYNFAGYSPWINWGENAIESYRTYCKNIFTSQLKGFNLEFKKAR